MKKIILMFTILSVVIVSFSNIIDFSFETINKTYLNDETKNYFDIYGKINIFSLYANIPLAIDNYYKKDFSEILIYPNKNINLDDLKVGIDIVDTGFRTNNLFVFPMMHMMYYKRIISKNNKKDNNIYIPFRISVENKIKNFKDYRKIDVVLSSGIVFDNKYIIEVGIKDNVENITNNKFNINWIIGFRYNIF
ncbi:hypothetical protein JCM30566_13480 [Marinitoga arctica]